MYVALCGVFSGRHGGEHRTTCQWGLETIEWGAGGGDGCEGALATCTYLSTRSTTPRMLGSDLAIRTILHVDKWDRAASEGGKGDQ